MKEERGSGRPARKPGTYATWPARLVWLLLLVACGAPAAPAVPTRQPLATAPPDMRPPTPPITAAAPLPAAPTATAITAATPAATPTPAGPPPLRLGAEAGVPAELAQAARQVSEIDPSRFAWTEAAEAEVRLVVGRGRPLAHWLYAIAAPFATVADGIDGATLAAAWSSGASPLGNLYLDGETAAALEAHWGAGPGPAATLVAADGLAAALWVARPALTLLPFHRLTPDLKVIRLDGQSPLDRAFDPGLYPLVVAVGVAGAPPAVDDFLALWQGPATNRAAGRLTRVAMTGVTALARATAFQMELQGVTRPGEGIAPTLAAADVVHISHEVPLAADCPYPNPIGDPIFCARDHYLGLLTSLGADVMELTGNHVNDWGPANLVHSIELYEAAGMSIFGGGRNLEEAERPAVIEHHGNRIAFTGCNPVGPPGTWATPFQAGSRPCHYDAFLAQIGRLRDEGHVVIATLQYWEFYHYPATAQQQADFRQLAAAGAAAVSGSQGHHAQGFDFHQGSFIHYGLGNLFFDQMDQLGTRQSFIDTYVIYDGRLLNVELSTALIENYCCPRPMTAAERAQLLQTVFQASGW